MKNSLKYFAAIALALSVCTSCRNYRKLITDEVILKDGNSQTGTLIKCDSVAVKIKKMDESVSIIPWSAIDSIEGKKLKTVFGGANFGYYKMPYFSVFRNQPFNPDGFGMEYKLGIATRGVKLYYLNLTLLPGAKPYSITKFGLGYQYYLGKSTYRKDKTYFVGTEVNMMNAKYNNGAQLTLEPFGGYEKKINEHVRAFFKFGLQINIANKNNNIGVNLTVGANFLKKNFKKYYQTLNHEHRIPLK